MIAEKLRRAVIQKAIEGNLFNIESEDKPIVPTYNTKKFYKKEKMYSEFSIPKNWIWTTLSRLFDKEQMNDGDWIVSNDMTEIEEIKLIQLGSIGKGKFINKEFKYISNEKFNELNCKEIKPNYLLFNRIVGGGINACIIPSYVDGKLITSVDALWIKPDTNINLKFIMYLLLSPYLENQINKLKAGTTRQRISKLNLINIPIPIPNIKIQNIIVEKLEVLLAEIDKLEQDEKALKDLEDKIPEKLKNAILRNAVSGKLTNQNLEVETTEDIIVLLEKKKNEKIEVIKSYNKQPFDIPENWRWIKIGDLGIMGMGQTLLKKDMVEKGDPVYSATISDDPLGYVNKDNNKLKLTKGDFVIPARGASIGYVNLIKVDEASSTQTTMYIKSYLPSISNYIYYCLLGMKKDVFTTTGTAQPQITVGLTKEQLIPLPPLEEQKRIVEKLDKLFAIDLLNI